jgi:hypothetical protein
MSGLAPANNKVYVTNSSYNLRKIGGSISETYAPEKEISIPARSVTTIVYELETATGIIPPENGQWQISPNPVSIGGKLTVRLPDAGNNLSFAIYSLLGQLIYTKNKTLAGIEETITVPSYLSKGIYLLKMQSGKNKYQRKITVTGY